MWFPPCPRLGTPSAISSVSVFVWVTDQSAPDLHGIKFKMTDTRTLRQPYQPWLSRDGAKDLRLTSFVGHADM